VNAHAREHDSRLIEHEPEREHVYAHVCVHVHVYAHVLVDLLGLGLVHDKA
jgi:hypothetical protein